MVVGGQRDSKQPVEQLGGVRARRRFQRRTPRLQRRGLQSEAAYAVDDAEVSKPGGEGPRGRQRHPPQRAVSVVPGRPRNGREPRCAGQCADQPVVVVPSLGERGVELREVVAGECGQRLGEPEVVADAGTGGDTGCGGEAVVAPRGGARGECAVVGEQLAALAAGQDLTV